MLWLTAYLLPFMWRGSFVDSSNWAVSSKTLVVDWCEKPSHVTNNNENNNQR